MSGRVVPQPWSRSNKLPDLPAPALSPPAGHPHRPNPTGSRRRGPLCVQFGLSRSTEWRKGDGRSGNMSRAFLAHRELLSKETTQTHSQIFFLPARTRLLYKYCCVCALSRTTLLGIVLKKHTVVLSSVFTQSLEEIQNNFLKLSYANRHLGYSHCFSITINLQ